METTISGARKRLAQKYAIGGTCHYCGKAPGTTLDHIIPKAMGGTLYLWNVQPACSRCNHRKADRWPTCTCEKCQAAIVRHLSWTPMAAKTFERLDGKRKILESTVQSLYDTIERTKGYIAEHDELVASLRDLTEQAKRGRVST